METEEVVVVINKGLVQDVYSHNANLIVKVIDLDMKRIGEEYLNEFTWPETQFDEDKITELIN